MPSVAIALGGQLERHAVEIGPADQGRDDAALGRFLRRDLAVDREAVEAEAEIGREVRRRAVGAGHVELHAARRAVGRQQAGSRELPVRIDAAQRRADMQVVDRQRAEVDADRDAEAAGRRLRASSSGAAAAAPRRSSPPATCSTRTRPLNSEAERPADPRIVERQPTPCLSRNSIFATCRSIGMKPLIP